MLFRSIIRAQSLIVDRRQPFLTNGYSVGFELVRGDARRRITLLPQKLSRQSPRRLSAASRLNQEVEHLAFVINRPLPNGSRSYDAGRDPVRFLGHDSALAISFFVEVGALQKLNPQTRHVEAAYLEALDAARDLIHENTRRVYSRAGKGVYLLAAADF